MGYNQKLVDDLVEQVAGLHLGEEILGVGGDAQGGKMYGDIVERGDGDDAFFPAYHIIVELGMASGKNNIKISPAWRSSGKAQAGIAVGDDDMLLVDILDLLVLGILGDAVQKVENNEFGIIGIAF